MKSNFFSIKQPALTVLLLIVALGSILRMQGVLTNSFAFTYDVGRDMLAISDIVHLVHFPFIGPTTGLPGVFYGPWWYWLLSPFFVISGGNPQGIALVMSLIGIASIFLSYILGRKVGKELVAISFAALTSVSQLLISLSSQIWSPDVAPFFVLVVLIVILNIYSGKGKRPLNYFVLGVLLMLIVDFEIVFGLMFSIGIILALVSIKKFKFLVKEIVFFILGSFLILSPRILFEFKNNFLMTKSFISYFAAGGEKRLPFFETVQNRVDIFLNHFAESLAGGHVLFSLILAILIVFSTVYFFKKANTDQKNLIKTSGIIIGTFFLGSLAFGHDIWPHYLVGLPILYILLFVISLSLLKDRLRSAVIPFSLLVFVFILNFNPVTFFTGLNKPLWEGDASVYRNQLKVIDYIYQEADKQEFKYVLYTPPLHDYTYKYLFNWYGKNKYGYTPSERSDLAFFILEPDLENPKRLTDWLNSREKDGHISNSQNIAGGVIVQTRTSDETVK